MTKIYAALIIYFILLGVIIYFFGWYGVIGIIIGGFIWLAVAIKNAKPCPPELEDLFEH